MYLGLLGLQTNVIPLPAFTSVSKNTVVQLPTEFNNKAVQRFQSGTIPEKPSVTMGEKNTWRNFNVDVVKLQE